MLAISFHEILRNNPDHESTQSGFRTEWLFEAAFVILLKRVYWIH
jgi:hypothetical protein